MGSSASATGREIIQKKIQPDDLSFLVTETMTAFNISLPLRESDLPLLQDEDSVEMVAFIKQDLTFLKGQLLPLCDERIEFV